MKDIIRGSIKHLAGKRYLIALLVVLLLLTLIFVFYVAITIEASDLRVVNRYSAFGVTHFYRSQWFYLLGFALYAVIVAVVHSVIAIKVLITKEESLAIGTVWLGILLIVLAWATHIRIAVFS